jgi:hypothetical protein
MYKRFLSRRILFGLIVFMSIIKQLHRNTKPRAITGLFHFPKSFHFFFSPLNALFVEMSISAYTSKYFLTFPHPIVTILIRLYFKNSTYESTSTNKKGTGQWQKKL